LIGVWLAVGALVIAAAIFLIVQTSN